MVMQIGGVMVLSGVSFMLNQLVAQYTGAGTHGATTLTTLYLPTNLP